MGKKKIVVVLKSRRNHLLEKQGNYSNSYFSLKNAIFTVFSQQILYGKLLLAITSGQKNNFNGGFTLKTYNNLPT